MSAKKKASDRDTSEIEAKVRDSASRVWLAGLGALALAEKEGGKLFKSLVAKGETVESSGRARIEQFKEGMGAVAEAAKEKLESASNDVRDRAGETWSKVEREIDARVASALEKVGVPSKSEISRLTRRIEELTAMVEKQAKARSAAAKGPGSKSGRTKRPGGAA